MEHESEGDGQLVTLPSGLSYRDIKVRGGRAVVRADGDGQLVTLPSGLSYRDIKMRGGSGFGRPLYAIGI